MNDIQVLVEKVLDLLSEIETYSFYKNNLVKSLDKLFALYQQGKFSYFQYEQEQKRILKGRTKEEWINYYNAYILSLLKKIETYNSQIFYDAYNDTRHLKMAAALPRALKPATVKAPEAVKVVVKERLVVERKPETVEQQVMSTIAPEVVEPSKVLPAENLVEVKPSVVEKISLFFKHLFAKKIESRMKELKVEKPMTFAKPDVTTTKIPMLKKKKHFFNFFLKKEKAILPAEEKPKPKLNKEEVGGVEFGKMFGLDYFRNLLSRTQEVSFSEKSGEIPLSTIQLETLRRKAKPEIEAQIEKITATALTKEASRIRTIMERRKVLKIYQPSFFGSIANLMIKKISFSLLDNFPDFFKELYHALRLANIKVLSNTYVNMMVLGVISSTLFGLFFFGFVFAATALPITQILSRTFMMSLILGVSVFGAFYAYPYQKLKARRRSINTNLPFAINHMAAVAGSGVSPVRMFKLISESREYGEVSVEIEKIVNYVEIFGYDVLTSLKAIASTTPSAQFKDFFEGMISTTQTGGDLKAYLSQKSEEAMMNYKLERQKYTETIATYSDIYTGILIAAPLFFVAALSMVSLLGGKVGGMSVDSVIVLGTYVAIPMMNVGFMTFLAMTQPEI
jgi:flagellar protein FlaJ